MNDEMTDHTKPCAELSDRERAALQLKTEGKTNREIAHLLNLGLTTVDKMFSNTDDSRAIYRKIGVKSQAEAVAWFTANRNCQEPAPPDQIDELNGESLQVDKAVQGAAPITCSEYSVRPFPWAFVAPMIVLYAGIVGLNFLPAIVRGYPETVDNVLLNLYALIAAAAGVYGLGHFQGRPPFLHVFRLFSLGLIFWAMGGAIWTVYDVIIGLEPHYPSWADAGYFGQTVIQLVSFGLWWAITTKHGELNPILWLPIALALFIMYCFTLLYAVQLAGGPIPDIPLLTIDLLNAAGDTISASLAICLVLPTVAKLYTGRVRLAMRLVSAGMILFYFIGSAYMLSVAVPNDHLLFYPAGGWIDASAGIVMLIWCMGIAVASTTDVAFQENV